MKKLEALINELEVNIPKQGLLNPNVSRSSVGWHIEHALLTLNVIIDAIKRSNPAEYKWSFNVKRTFVFIMNKIPRGRVQAPAVVRPKTNFDIHTLNRHIAHSRANLKMLEDVDGNAFFEHPFLGKMNKSPAIRFLRLHTAHHVHIIRDIVKNSG
jgi:hypothetical protein